jgi:hypothetical protein
VLFADDTEASLKASVALVNTAGAPDTLTEIAQLDAFYEEHGYTGRRDGDAAASTANARPAPARRRAATEVS